MPTIREKLIEMLEGHGLFESDAKAILDQYLASDFGKSMQRQMNDDLEGCPPQLLPTVWMAVKTTAADWIDRNCPKHWARPMFDPASNLAERP